MERNRAEWLEADGLGGYASGTRDGIRTRRYHAWLVTAATPPTSRFVLVNGCEAWIETPEKSFPITSQLYRGGASDVLHPNLHERDVRFRLDPWPTWRIECRGGPTIEHAIVVQPGASRACLTWRLASPPAGRTVLGVRLLVSGRDSHSLQHENGTLRFDPEQAGDAWTFRPYDGVPAFTVRTNASYRHEPAWYRGFLYEEERARGFDHVEDLASPGVFRFDLGQDEAVMLLDGGEPPHGFFAAAPRVVADTIRADERSRRMKFPTALHRAADSYIVRRGAGRTIVAGYPWFTDWGRDTFIALRGLCLASGRFDDARAILLEWAATVDRGMLPNRFPENGATPEYNAVDASLWFIVAVQSFEAACAAAGTPITVGDATRLHAAVLAILQGYATGTRLGIRMDDDGLLRSGEPGSQLTWMDAKIGDWVVTPRAGKPVEVQALWYNALLCGGQLDREWQSAAERVRAAFEARFWNEAAGCLYDVVDVDHIAAAVDARIRPNQILAVGGLPQALLDGERAARLVATVEETLWTPAGLRSLAPGSADYAQLYEGDPRSRDAAYHQGTVWPWLAGPFVEAWVRVHGGTDATRAAARQRFLEPLLRHLDPEDIGHLPEIADAEPPHAPRGAPFQAWSVGEALRLQASVLAATAAPSRA